MATHSSVLAWRIPGTGEPGGLLSMGSHRVGRDSSDSAAVASIQRIMLMAESASVGVGLDLKFCISNQLLRTLAHTESGARLQRLLEALKTPHLIILLIYTEPHFHSLYKSPQHSCTHRRTHTSFGAVYPQQEKACEQAPNIPTCCSGTCNHQGRLIFR